MVSHQSSRRSVHAAAAAALIAVLTLQPAAQECDRSQIPDRYKWNLAELRMHEMAQKGQPITGDALATLYMEITRKYYGHDQGVCVVDDDIAHEWSYIPHFYRDFYVFQYATSFTASSALAAKVKSGDALARKRYLESISAGGSKYPIDLLEDAGVDMTTDEPLDLTMKEMNRVMDEMERLLAKRTPSSQPR